MKTQRKRKKCSMTVVDKRNLERKIKAIVKAVETEIEFEMKNSGIGYNPEWPEQDRLFSAATVIEDVLAGTFASKYFVDAAKRDD